MNTRKHSLGLGIVLIALLLPATCRVREAQCEFCDRPIHYGMKATVTLQNKRSEACCISCAMKARAQDKNAVVNTVTDFNTNQPLVPQTAFYVLGSNTQPCGAKEKAIRDEHSAAFEMYDRCEPSVLAFAASPDTKKFQADHGGRILTFSELETVFRSSPPHEH